MVLDPLLQLLPLVARRSLHVVLIHQPTAVPGYDRNDRGYEDQSYYEDRGRLCR